MRKAKDQAPWPPTRAGASPRRSTDPVSLWIAQLKQGERSAVGPLLQRYFGRLVQLARARLQARPGLAAADEDVALSAFKSLCLGAERGRFPQLNDRDDLWRLLALLTVRKAIDVQRRQRARGEAGETEVEQLLSREPSPELAAELAEEYRALLDRLGDPQLQAVALWKVEGYANEEIARKLGCGLRSVERKLHLIRVLLGGEAAR
jgi:DNA-directed RNA polymerase specialized sigma24 family protein